MKTEILTCAEFKDLLRTISIEKIKYFDFDIDLYHSSDTCRFVVVHNDKMIIGICKFAYWDLSKNYCMSYVSTHPDYMDKGIAKSILNELFKYFRQNYVNETLCFTGYSIDGWKYIRPAIFKYSEQFNVKIDEKAIEYITDWTDEARLLFDQSREIISKLYPNNIY